MYLNIQSCKIEINKRSLVVCCFHLQVACNKVAWGESLPNLF